MPSDVWKFFTKKEGNSCVCNLCGSKYKNSGNTTNLRNHLKGKHYHAFVACPSKDRLSGKENHVPSNARDASTSRSRSRSPIIPTTQCPSAVSIQLDSEDEDNNLIEHSMQIDAETASTSTGTGGTTYCHSNTARSQQSVFDIFKGQRTYADGGLREAAITQSLLYMICKDNLPLSCTEKDGMKRFLKTTVPLYTPKSRQAITRMIENKYESLSTVVGRSIADVNYLSLTTDIATVMNSTKSFIVLTGHYLDASSVMMHSFCLGARQLQPHHTAIHINEDLVQMLDQFKIDKSKIVSVTTDGGANIVAAVRILLGSSKFHIPCLAHMINLVVQNGTDAVPEFKEISEKVKALVTYFKRSNVAMDDLRAEQAREGKSEGKFLYLIQDVMTRWNSTFYALQRFVTLSGHIGKILLLSKHKNAPPMLTPMEVDIVRDCIVVLKPFEAATKEISGEKYVTASMVIPIVNCVRGQLRKTLPESETAKQLKSQLEEKMHRRMADLEKVELLAIATVLDPRFKKLHFQSAVNASSAIACISREVRHQLHALDEQLSSSSNDEAPADPNNLWSIHDKEAAKNTPESPSLTGHSLPHELKLYLQQPFQARTSNPIKFWQDSKNAFPGTYRVAMKYLTVLGTSVPSERTVSRLNYVASDNRSRLTSAHTDMLVFLGSLDEKLWFA